MDVSTFNSVVLYTVTVLSFIAMLTYGWACTKVVRPLNLLYGSITALAGFYTIAYAWLIFHPEAAAEWSYNVRVVGILTWITVWISQPIVAVWITRRREQATAAARRVWDKRHARDAENAAEPRP